MTTSGSRNFTVSRAEIIEEAVANIGALDPGNTLSAEETARASLRLNLMIKGWMAKGANLWRREEVILFLQSGQQSYTFGTDRFARKDDVVEAALTSAFTAGSFTFYVASTTGIDVGDAVGVKLDSGAVEWIAGGVFAKTSTSITTFVALAGTASAGNAVYTHPATDGLVISTLNPIKVAHAFTRDDNNLDTTVRLISREEYAALSMKGASGPVNCIHHDRRLTSRILVWPAVDTSRSKLHLIVDRVVEDFDGVADTPDFPMEWMNALMWGLSAELSNTYGLPIAERVYLKQNAAMEFEAANTFDIDDATVRFEYDVMGGRH